MLPRCEHLCYTRLRTHRVLLPLPGSTRRLLGYPSTMDFDGFLPWCSNTSASPLGVGIANNSSSAGARQCLDSFEFMEVHPLQLPRPLDDNDDREGPTASGSSPSTSTQSDCAVFDFAVYTVVVGSLCLFGVVGNTMSFIVLQRQRRTDTSGASRATTLLLRALAVADSLVLVVAVPLYALTPVSTYIRDAGGGGGGGPSLFEALFRRYRFLYPSIVPYLWPLYLMPYTATVWLTVLVSADRYAAVCRPFRSAAAGKLRAGSRTCRQVLGVAVFAVVYNIPRFFEYEAGGGDDDVADESAQHSNSSSLSIFTVLEGVENSSFFPVANSSASTERVEDVTTALPGLGLSALGANKVYRIVYANALYFVVMHGGPIILLSFLNARLIRTLKAQEDRKRKMIAGCSSSTGGGQQVTYYRATDTKFHLAPCTYYNTRKLLLYQF